MGFYGNITNTSNTTFQFDRIYSNRLSMDANVNNDGIFIGRYVLVEYERNAAYPVVYTKTVNGILQFYSSPNCEDITRIKFGTGNDRINENDIVKSYPQGTHETTTDGGEWPTNTDNIKFYRCIGEDTNHYAIFTEIINESELFEKSDYIINYGIDENHYKPTGENERRNYKGYDSTVWTKVSETSADGKLITKYVNIADLNSVVPTFDITEDAPTMNALTPHFDADGTNVYYKLHMQTPYGFRVKAADNKAGSDLKTIHITAGYDANNNMISKAKTEVNADIYYNNAGFDETKSSFKEANTDVIKILPTGTSGKAYSHYPDLPADMEMEKWGGDIQELSIRLPSIGNTISKVWDIIYDNNNGYGVDGGTRYRDLDWQYVIDDTTGELRETKDGGKTVDVSTVAGCINSVHNLMGQIIVGSKPEADQGKKDYIYFDGTSYWKIVDKYIYSEPISEIDNNIEYYVISDTNNIFTKGTIWNNNVTIPNGVTIGTRTIQNEWKQLDLGEHFDTLHGQILKFNHIYSEALIDSETRDDDTIVGNINRLNDIIAKFAELVPGEIMVVDEYGRMHSAEYTTAQPFTSKNYGKSINGTNSTSYGNTEDRWIQLDINTKYDNPSITIAHKHTPVNDTTTKSNKNIPVTSNGGINNDTDDDLRLYTPIIDSMGHIVGKNIETVTLPYGYKHFKTDGLSSKDVVNDLYSTVNYTSTEDVKTTNDIANSSVAHNTQDVLTINPHNKWIQTKIENTDNDGDILTIAHEIHSIDERYDSNTNLNNLSIDNENGEGNLTIYDWSYDKAGHITAKRKHTYTLPYGFKTIEVVNSTGNGAAPKSTTTKDNNDTALTTQAAETTQDTLSFKATNKWITMEAVDGDIINFGHVLSPETIKEHKSTDTSVANFGDSFNVLNFDIDEAGHITRVGQTTITTPVGTFSDTASSNNANVITSVVYTPTTGAIEIAHQDAGTLKLGTAYTANKKGALTFDGENTINDALSAIQAHINESEYTESGNQYFIDSITQVDGKIATTRKGTAGTLIVGYDTTNKLIGKDDSVNTAFDTIDKAIAKEVSDRIAADTAEATTRANADTAEKNAREAADNAEKLAREAGDQAERAALNAAIEQEVSDRDDAINAAIAGLVDSAPDNLNTLQKIVKWIDADEDGAIDLAANVAKNAEDINTLNTNLKSAAYETKETFVLKTDYDTKVASLEAIILDLTNRIATLEEKMEENHPTEASTPDEGETI